MFPILQIGPLAIQVPGLVLLVGLWLGLTLSERLLHESKHQNMQANDISNLAYVSLAAGVISARVGFALRFPAAFALNPLDLLSLSPALLDPWFGLLTGLIAATAFAQQRRLPARLVLDVLTPLFAIMTAAWFLSNLASGNGYGLPTNVPWAINLFGALRHPAQIYDFLAAFAIFAFLWIRRRNFSLGNGIFFLIFLALTSGSMLFLDAFHASGPILPGGWRTPQIAAWLVLAGSLWGLRSLEKIGNENSSVGSEGRPRKPEMIDGYHGH